jgi:nucleotide-binding universal stress UspA family protein
MKRILVPCDFSGPSKEAFKVASEIAQKAKGEIFVVYAIPNPALYNPGISGEGFAYSDQLIMDIETDAKENFEQLKATVGQGIQTSLQLKVGSIFEFIKEFTRTRKIDLIVMGTSGSSGLQEILIGSNTEKVVRFADVPVLVVRTAFTLSSVKNILVPSTLGLDQTGFFKNVTDLQTFFNATLHVLLVNTPDGFRRNAEAQEAFAEFARHYHLSNCQFHFRSDYSEEAGIMDFMQHEKMDLLAMGTHGRIGLAHLFNGSITEHVVNHIEYPVWTCALKK